jgi:hypothetical protein
LRIFYAQADTEGCAYYRTYLPGTALAGLPGVEVIATHEVEIDKHIPWADVIVEHSTSATTNEQNENRLIGENSRRFFEELQRQTN